MANSIGTLVLDIGYPELRLPNAFDFFDSNDERPAVSRASIESESGNILPETQWPGRELNPRHADFQSAALPTELPGLLQVGARNIHAYLKIITRSLRPDRKTLICEHVQEKD